MKFRTLRWIGVGTLVLLNTSCSLGGDLNVEQDKTSIVPIVYSTKYKISVYGMEKLHPFDIAKYNKIFNGLKKDGLATKENVIVPEEVTREQLLLVHSEKYLERLKTTKNVARYLGRVDKSIIDPSR